jgi:SAM-dependent methyltransferase
MLDAAQRHPRITYFHGSGDALGQLPVPAIDVVTFAGSMAYAKSDRLRRELIRVCPPGGTVIVYDFEVPLDAAIAALGADCPAAPSSYDYQSNILDWAEFGVESSGTERVRLVVAADEMAHLLMADSNRYDALSRRFPNGDPFEKIVDYFEISSGGIHLDAVLYFTRYRFMASTTAFRP